MKLKERSRRLIFLLIGVVLFLWVWTVRPENGEAQQISEVPIIGNGLPPLESTQPLLYQVRRTLIGDVRAVLFRGMTMEKSIHAFAAAHQLQSVTNEVKRTQLLKAPLNWKVDPDRFPVFKETNDVCYAGSFRNGFLEICHRPEDGRFTAFFSVEDTAAPR